MTLAVWTENEKSKGNLGEAAETLGVDAVLELFAMAFLGDGLLITPTILIILVNKYAFSVGDPPSFVFVFGRVMKSMGGEGICYHIEHSSLWWRAGRFC